MSDGMIPVYQPYLGGREKEYVNQCLDSTWISSRGEFIGRFESSFAQYIGARHATTVANGTVALHLALASLGIGHGDEVIVPTLTYVASVNTIIQTGAQPIYVDSLANTWNADPDDIRRKITPRTKAVMVVHLYGLPCDMEAICKICDDNKLLLIEDCAESFGAYYKGQHTGTFGDIATFSFFGNKTITTGEGGMVVAKDSEVINRARHLKSQGVSPDREYWHDVLAYNYRMTNIQAAVGLAQLEQADEIIAKKRRVADWYARELTGLPLELHQEQSGTKHSFWMCSIAVLDTAKRDNLRHYLRQNGVETRPAFPCAHSLPHCSQAGTYSTAESISARGINLPSYPSLTAAELNHIASKIRDFL